MNKKSFTFQKENYEKYDILYDEKNISHARGETNEISNKEVNMETQELEKEWETGDEKTRISWFVKNVLKRKKCKKTYSLPTGSIPRSIATVLRALHTRVSSTTTTKGYTHKRLQTFSIKSLWWGELHSKARGPFTHTYAYLVLATRCQRAFFYAHSHTHERVSGYTTKYLQACSFLPSFTSVSLSKISSIIGLVCKKTWNLNWIFFSFLIFWMIIWGFGIESRNDTNWVEVSEELLLRKNTSREVKKNQHRKPSWRKMENIQQNLCVHNLLEDTGTGVLPQWKRKRPESEEESGSRQWPTDYYYYWIVSEEGWAVQKCRLLWKKKLRTQIFILFCWSKSNPLKLKFSFRFEVTKIRSFH